MAEVKGTVARTIDGKGKTVRDLLNAKRYSIDYYQTRIQMGNQANQWS